MDTVGSVRVTPKDCGLYHADIGTACRSRTTKHSCLVPEEECKYAKPHSRMPRGTPLLTVGSHKLKKICIGETTKLSTCSIDGPNLDV